MLKTAAIILNYYSHEDTIDLYRQLNGFGNIRLMVVDNSNDPEETHRLQKKIHPDHLLFASKNLGYAGGNNLGIRALLRQERPDLIALLNPDIRLKENIFPALGKMFEENPRLGAAGPRLCIRGDEERIYSDGGRIQFNGRYLAAGHINGGKTCAEVQNPSSNSPKKGKQESAGASDVQDSTRISQSPISYVNGSFLVMRTEAFLDTGYLDERFFLYFEEADWCMRAADRGWKLQIDPSLVAWQRISSKTEAYNYYFYRSWFLFLHRHGKEGMNLLLKDQLKKIKWTLERKDLPSGRRMRIAGNRLMGVIQGYFNF